MSPVDPLARQLAMLLRVADLAGRITPSRDLPGTSAALLHLVRRAARADRVSLFEIENAAADAPEPLSVIRVARDVEVDDGIRAEAPFHPHHVALLLAPLQTGTIEALGPLDGEDLHVHHHHEEPTTTRYTALAPLLVDGHARGVLEVARAGEPAFDARDLTAIEAGARAVSAALWGTRREATIQSFLAGLLPEILDPARAATSLPDRVRAWLTTRKLDPAERRTLALATSIAELGEASPLALEMVQTVLAAARRAFVRDLREWSEIDRGR